MLIALGERDCCPTIWARLTPDDICDRTRTLVQGIEVVTLDLACSLAKHRLLGHSPTSDSARGDHFLESGKGSMIRLLAKMTVH